MAETDDELQLVRRARDRLKVGFFDSETLGKLTEEQLSELAATDAIARHPNVREALLQLIQVKQTRRLADQLAESMAALDSTLRGAASSSEDLGRRMMRLSLATVVLSIIMAVAATLAVGQVVCRWLGSTGGVCRALGTS